jgi:hypothetical protein
VLDAPHRRSGRRCVAALGVRPGRISADGSGGEVGRAAVGLVALVAYRLRQVGARDRAPRRRYDRVHRSGIDRADDTYLSGSGSIAIL